MNYSSSSVQNLAFKFPSNSSLFPPLYGSIDLGTNTCRMLIAEANPYAKNPTGFRVLDSFSRVIRFGENLTETGVISSEAMDRALVALEECSRRLLFHRVKHVRCVATAACRNAKNAPLFVENVLAQTGLHFEIISPLEESSLAVAGCFDLLSPQIPYSVIFDIGGGSTEVVLIEILGKQEFLVIDCLSLPYGVLSLRDAVCCDEEKKEISQKISFNINEFAIRNGLYELVAQKKIQMVGASGTVTTLAAISMNLERYDRKKVHQTLLSSQELDRVIRYLWSMKISERLAHPCIGPQRADFIMGGVSIFQGIHDILAIDPVLVADRGVREGILRTLIAQTLSEPATYTSAA